jgi:hypothetical protein
MYIEGTKVGGFASEAAGRSRIISKIINEEKRHATHLWPDLADR